MEENIIFIGGKNLEVYLEAVLFKIERGPVHVKTRGKYIYEAVKLCEYLSRTKKIRIESVKIGSSVVEKNITIPEIEIVLIK